MAENGLKGGEQQISNGREAFTDGTSWRDIRSYTDCVMLFAAAILFLFGLAVIHSASISFYAPGDMAVSGSLARQAVWGIGSAVIYIAVIKTDYRNIMSVSAFLFVGMVIVFVLLLLAGHSAKGAQRWFDLGILRFQPSELGKVIFALALAKFCTLFPLDTLKGVLFSFCVAGLAILPIMLQPDLGSSLVYAVMFFAVFIAAGAPKKLLFGLIGVAAALLPLLWFAMKPYQRMRMMVFIDPSVDPQGAGYNVIQSRIAVGSGGLLGKGFLQGTQGKLHFLPEPHTDFIFSVFAEEFGFIGCVAVLLLFGILIYRILNVGEHTKDASARLLCVAIAAWLWFQVMESVAMSMGLAPVTGIPLPLFSYGGSSLIVVSLGLALVQSVNIVSQKSKF
ncbi:MAG: rod shape-determining protein RodA [Synergistes sp.]|nr:rod shape-determining protein RodA [Synergistes sp.]